MEPDHIGSLLTPSLKSLGVYTVVQKERVSKILESLLGKEMSSTCKVTRVSRGTVELQVGNAPLAAQLHYDTERLITAINAGLNEPAIRTLSVRQ